jgi:hypothetical protein
MSNWVPLRNKTAILFNPVLVILREQAVISWVEKVVVHKNDSSKFNLWEDGHHSVETRTIKGFEICICKQVTSISHFHGGIKIWDANLISFEGS